MLVPLSYTVSYGRRHSKITQINRFQVRKTKHCGIKAVMANSVMNITIIVHTPIITFILLLSFNDCCKTTRPSLVSLIVKLLQTKIKIAFQNKLTNSAANQHLKFINATLFSYQNISKKAIQQQ